MITCWADASGCEVICINKFVFKINRYPTICEPVINTLFNKWNRHNESSYTASKERVGYSRRIH